MAEYVNFYESVKEARMRLKGTAVLYDGLPYYVWAIADHKGPVFRVYMEPVESWDQVRPRPGHMLSQISGESSNIGPHFDQWMDANPTSRVIRKKMDSPHFNKFRPFPLGMCNVGEETYYIERQPQRRTEQGLTRSACYQTTISSGSRKSPRLGMDVDMMSDEMRDCILGRHPSAEECLEALLDDSVVNDAHAFHRNFALVRGPIDILLLAYKEDIIGVLPNQNFSLLRLGKKFAHTKEVVENLNLFTNVV